MIIKELGNLCSSGDKYSITNKNVKKVMYLLTSNPFISSSKSK